MKSALYAINVNNSLFPSFLLLMNVPEGFPWENVLSQIRAQQIASIFQWWKRNTCRESLNYDTLYLPSTEIAIGDISASYFLIFSIICLSEPVSTSFKFRISEICVHFRQESQGKYLFFVVFVSVGCQWTCSVDWAKIFQCRAHFFNGGWSDYFCHREWEKRNTKVLV